MPREREKISRIWKVGRLLIGKTQLEMAKLLNVSQASISMIESMAIEPSASDWFQFCQIVGIDSHKTIELGYIDGLHKFEDNLYDKSSIKLPAKYRIGSLIKVRELIPFKKCITEELGEEGWMSFLDENKIDKELFYIYDFQVSLELFRDILNWGIKQGINIIERALDYNDSFLTNSSVFTTSSRFLEQWIEDQSYFQKVFRPEIHEIGDTLKVNLTDLQKSSSMFGKSVVLSFTKYKVESFQRSIKKHLGSNHQLDILYRNDEISFLVAI